MCLGEIFSSLLERSMLALGRVIRLEGGEQGVFLSAFYSNSLFTAFKPIICTGKALVEASPAAYGQD